MNFLNIYSDYLFVKKIFAYVCLSINETSTHIHTHIYIIYIKRVGKSW